MFFQELWQMMRERKRYWLIPVIITLLLLSAFVLVSQVATTHFIYTVF